MLEDSLTPQAEASALFVDLPPEMQGYALQALRRLHEHAPYTGPFGWLLGIRYDDRTPGRMQCSLDVDESLFNPGKVAHGGVVYSLIDSAMGASVYSVLGPGQGCVTAELKVNYLRPILAGRIVASAKIVQRGRTLAVVTAEVHNADNKLVAIGMGTFAIIKQTGPRD